MKKFAQRVFACRSALCRSYPKPPSAVLNLLGLLQNHRLSIWKRCLVPKYERRLKRIALSVNDQAADQNLQVTLNSTQHKGQSIFNVQILQSRQFGRRFSIDTSSWQFIQILKRFPAIFHFQHDCNVYYGCPKTIFHSVYTLTNTGYIVTL